MACGGAVERAEGDAPSDEGQDAQGSGAARGDGNDAGDAGALPLEECELGLLPGESTDSCNWLADERCYETKAKACACICPRDGASVCSSDFYGGEGSRTKVSCR